MADEKMMGNEAAEQAGNAAPTFTGVPTGVAYNDPMLNEKIQNIMRLRGGDIARSAIMGAAMGSQAAQGAANPLAGVIQAYAAGLQAPAQIYAAKEKQVKSVVDATPFGITHKEVVDSNPSYKILAGLPTALALEAISGIARDAAKVAIEGEETRRTQKEQLGQQMALKAFESSLKGKDPAKYEDISAMAKDFRGLEQVQNYTIAKSAKEMISEAPLDAAGDLMIMANFAKILNPQTRFSESNLDATDISPYIDKFMPRAIFSKVVEGKKLQPEERIQLKAAAIKAFNVRKREYMDVADVWEHKATELGIDPNFVVSDKGWEQRYVNGKPVMARPLPNGQWEVRP